MCYHMNSIDYLFICTWQVVNQFNKVQLGMFIMIDKIERLAWTRHYVYSTIKPEGDGWIVENGRTGLTKLCKACDTLYHAVEVASTWDCVKDSDSQNSIQYDIYADGMNKYQIQYEPQGTCKVYMSGAGCIGAGYMNLQVAFEAVVELLSK